jgi:hypothetical protein
MSLDKHTAYYNLLDALPQPGCALCRLGHRVEVNYIENVLYSKTTAISTRAEWREARGLCLTHAKQLNQIGHALGVSLFYQDITQTVKALIEGVSPQQAVRPRGKRRLLERLVPRVECPACAYRATLEAVYVETLLDHLTDAEFVTRLRDADPLCLAHFQQTIEIVSDAESFRTLRDVQVEHWERLIAELGEFVRKNDHRFQHESVGQEGTAWLRVVDAIAGTCDVARERE